MGFVIGGKLVHHALEEYLAPLLVGEDPFMTEALWQRMFEKTLLRGRRGGLMRAISIADIALVGPEGQGHIPAPIQAAGGIHSSIPVYVSAAYYAAGQTPDDVAIGRYRIDPR